MMGANMSDQAALQVMRQALIAEFDRQVKTIPATYAHAISDGQAAGQIDLDGRFNLDQLAAAALRACGAAWLI